MLDEVKVIRRKIADGLLDNIVLDGKIVVCAGLSEEGGGDVKGGVDLGGERVEIVLSIEVEVDAMVTKCFEVGLAAGDDVALRVRGAHVGGIFADNVGNCALVLHHLLYALVVCDV